MSFGKIIVPLFFFFLRSAVFKCGSLDFECFPRYQDLGTSRKGLMKSHQTVASLHWEVRLRMCVLWKSFCGRREIYNRRKNLEKEVTLSPGD